MAPGASCSLTMTYTPSQLFNNDDYPYIYFWLRPSDTPVALPSPGQTEYPTNQTGLPHPGQPTLPAGTTNYWLEVPYSVKANPDAPFTVGLLLTETQEGISFLMSAVDREDLSVVNPKGYNSDATVETRIGGTKFVDVNSSSGLYRGSSYVKYVVKRSTATGSMRETFPEGQPIAVSVRKPNYAPGSEFLATVVSNGDAEQEFCVRFTKRIVPGAVPGNNVWDGTLLEGKCILR